MKANPRLMFEATLTAHQRPTEEPNTMLYGRVNPWGPWGPVVVQSAEEVATIFGVDTELYHMSAALFEIDPGATVEVNPVGGFA